jgi:uncharacterized membrane protein (DUF373 family)
MRWLRRLSKQVESTTGVENFLHFLDRVESLVAKVLSLAMVLVLVFTVFDLGVYLVVAVFTLSPEVRSEKSFILEIFGLFLNVLIALELMENITAYLRKHVVQVELVFMTALIAGARKIIILDFEKVSGGQLLGLAAAVLSLSISYWIMRQANVRNH